MREQKVEHGGGQNIAEAPEHWVPRPRQIGKVGGQCGHPAPRKPRPLPRDGYNSLTPNSCTPVESHTLT